MRWLAMVLLTACAAPASVPERGRVVSMDPEVPVAEAVAVWTAHRGVAPYDETGPTRVVISTDRELGALGSGAKLLGLAHLGVDVCWIELSPSLSSELRVQVLAHEIGHCLGYAHDLDDEGSLMYPHTRPGQVLREQHR